MCEGRTCQLLGNALGRKTPHLPDCSVARRKSFAVASLRAVGRITLSSRNALRNWAVERALTAIVAIGVVGGALAVTPLGRAAPTCVPLATPTVPNPFGDVDAAEVLVCVDVTGADVVVVAVVKYPRRVLGVELPLPEVDKHVTVAPHDVMVMIPGLPEKEITLGPFTTPPVHVDNHVIDAEVPPSTQEKVIVIGPTDKPDLGPLGHIRTPHVGTAISIMRGP